MVPAGAWFFTRWAVRGVVRLERVRDHWNRELVWRQPSVGRAEFVLRHGPLTFARFSGPAGARSRVEAHLFDRDMVLERGGLWSPRLTVEDLRREERVANVLRVKRAVHEVEFLASGRRYVVRSGWGPRRVESLKGEVLLGLEPKWRLFRLEADLSVSEPAAALDELPVLVALQWYLHVLAGRALAPASLG